MIVGGKRRTDDGANPHHYGQAEQPLVFKIGDDLPERIHGSDILSERSQLLPQSTAHMAAFSFSFRKLLQLCNSGLNALDRVPDAPHVTVPLKYNFQVRHHVIPDLDPGEG